jgi:large subunit ribosomal protein L25
MKVVTLKTGTRNPNGTAGARRLRRAGRLPAVLYGDGKDAVHLDIDAREFTKAVDHGARVIDLELDGAQQRALLKELQYDPLGLHLRHADFVRVNPDVPIELRIPLDLRGVPAGLSKGGVLNVPVTTILVRCLPGDLPENIPLDISKLDLGDSVTAGDLVLPSGVQCAEDPDRTVVTMIVPRGVSADAEAAAEPAAPAGETPDGE